MGEAGHLQNAALGFDEKKLGKIKRVRLRCMRYELQLHKEERSLLIVK